MITTDRGFVSLALAGGFVLLVLLVRLVVFAQAAAPLPAIGWSATPWNAFLTRHACATAYWKAATEVRQTPNVYALANPAAGPRDAQGRPIPPFIGPYAIDPYEYPPTFLLLPRLLALVTPDFPAFRLLWGLVATIVTLAGVALVARHLDRENGTHSLWLAPLVFVPLGVITTIQGGNAQLFFVVLAMLGMLAFDRRQPAAGGLLLAYAIVGKMFPGLLLVYLAVRREWRAVAWTAGWSIVLTLVTLADVGWAPFAAFLDHLPRLLSGEAFPMLQLAGPSDISLSVPGLVLKLQRFGGPALGFGALHIAGWIYSAVILVATVRLASRPIAPRLAPLAWLVVLGLATLRAPFLPGYGVFQAVWIATILLALSWRDAPRRWLLLALWASLLWMTAGPLTTPLWIIATATTLQIAVIVGLYALAVATIRAARVSERAASAAGR
jgi:hypothetical protein